MAIDKIQAYNPFLAKINAIPSGEYVQPNQKIGETQAQPINFGQLTKQPETQEAIAPPNAKQNYENGLAPLSVLQNVYAGEYNGKENILNQLGIA